MSVHQGTETGAMSEREAALQMYCRHLEREYKSFAGGLGELLDIVEGWRQNVDAEESARWENLHRRATRLLIQHGIRPTARLGQEVDLRLHKVVATRHDPNVAADGLLEILNMGYELTLPGRGSTIVREAQVVISSGPAPDAEGDAIV